MVNKQQSIQTSLLVIIIITLESMTSTTTTGTSVATGTNGTVISNGISTADDENNLINDLVKTGKFTEDEARELVTKVMLIDNLVKTGKFTEDEARELATKMMNNGTDEAQ